MLVSTAAQKEYFTEREVKETFGLGLRKLRNWRMAQKEGPPWIKISGEVGKTGGRVLYPASGLRKWLAEFHAYGKAA